MNINLMRRILLILVDAEKYYGLPNASVRYCLHEAISEAQNYSNSDPSSCFEEA